MEPSSAKARRPLDRGARSRWGHGAWIAIGGAIAVMVAVLFLVAPATWHLPILTTAVVCLSISLAVSRTAQMALRDHLDAQEKTANLLLADTMRYRLMVENVTDVIWILDIRTQKMTYVSPSVEKTLGYPPDELKRMPMEQYLTADAHQLAHATLRRMQEQVAAGTIDPKVCSTRLELEGVHKTRTIIPVEVTASLMVDDGGGPEAVLGISRDLSSRKAAEKERAEMETQLQKAQKMESLGTMAGSIAHNFNNLLMVVSGNLELAKESLPEGSNAAGNIDRATNAAQRAADLSGLMLTYVGQLKKESIPVDLAQSVRAVLEEMDESMMSRISLDLDLADPMPLVVADADQMQQMIKGFVSNAFEALGEDGGTVGIAAGTMHCDRPYLATTYLKEEMPEGLYAFVRVTDTGCGMDAITLDKIFDPFFSTKFTGRGLGMSAVMGIIRAHGGAVQVESSPNRGSTFTALFPIQAITVRHKPPKSIEMAEKTGERVVLLVDDDEMVMEIGDQFLQRLGYKVMKASSGPDAVATFERVSRRIACVLLDYTMPGMDGLETMQRLREIDPTAKIIISSGYTRRQIEGQFARVGPPNDFIHKPFEMKALADKLTSLLR